MNETLLTFAIGLGTAALVATSISRARSRRAQKQALNAEIGKWEDEGGNVPEVPTPRPLASIQPSMDVLADRGASISN